MVSRSSKILDDTQLDPKLNQCFLLTNKILRNRKKKKEDKEERKKNPNQVAAENENDNQQQINQ